MLDYLKNKDTISIYELFNNDIMVTLFIIFLFLSTGIQWLIPIPPYPYVPFWGLSEYMAVIIVYIIIRKLINKNYSIKLPNITKKIIINLKKIKENKNFIYNININSNTHNIIDKRLLLGLFLIAGIFIIVPINDIPLSMLCAYICYNYFKNDKKSLYISIVSLILLLTIYFYILFKLISNRGYIGNYINKFKTLFIIIILVLIISLMNKINLIINKYKGSYKEYITIPHKFKFMDLFKK
tara:strand:- start:4090 stop:4809 length:720 start_codon:yes stop_codon:yes gene_type:complete